MRKTRKSPRRSRKGRKYQGVFPSLKNHKACIREDDKTRYLGTFTTQEEAARVYDKRACELHGPAAILNFPGEHKDCTDGCVSILPS